MRNRCRCLPEDRTALFMTFNGQTVYMCRKCGRYHDTRHLPKHWHLMWAGICAGALLLLSAALLLSGN